MCDVDVKYVPRYLISRYSVWNLETGCYRQLTSIYWSNTLRRHQLVSTEFRINFQSHVTILPHQVQYFYISVELMILSEL